MTETVTFPAVAANKAFDNDLYDLRRGVESPNLPGFRDLDSAINGPEVRHGEIGALFLITRISDGKIFGAGYKEPVVDYETAESPFHGSDDVTFTEVAKLTRTVVEEYWVIVP